MKYLDGSKVVPPDFKSFLESQEFARQDRQILNKETIENLDLSDFHWAIGQEVAIMGYEEVLRLNGYIISSHFLPKKQ